MGRKRAGNQDEDQYAIGVCIHRKVLLIHRFLGNNQAILELLLAVGNNLGDQNDSKESMRV